MTDDPSLKAAHALDGTDAVKDLYKAWAETYDSGFVKDEGYQLPKQVAVAYAEIGGVGPVLDVGAGTGLCAEALVQLGVGPIDGVDLTPEMLAKAAQKGVYRNLIEADITQPLPGAPTFAGIVSAGTFTLGHVGPEGVKALLDGAAPGTLFVIAVHARHFVGAGFAGLLEEVADQITELRFKEVPIYDGSADDAHKGAAHQKDTSRLMIFRSV